MNLEELVKSYLWVLKVEKRLSLNSLKSYEYDFKIFSNWLKTHKMDVFKEDLVIKYYEYLKVEKGNLENSILRKINLVIALFKYSNEEKGCKFFIPERKNKKLVRTYRVFMESEDLQKIRNYLFKNLKSKRLLAIVEILYSTGLRVSELLKLKTIDINEIKKNRSLQIIGKGGIRRMVFFNDLAVKAIEEYLEEFNKKSMDGLLFPVTRQRVFQLLKQLAHELNIDLDKIFPHSFRHRLLTDLVQKGMNLVNIQKIAGHKQIATTEKYTHVEDYLYEDIYKYHPLIKKMMG